MTTESPTIVRQRSPIYAYIIYGMIGSLMAISVRIIANAILSPPMNYTFVIIGHRELVLASSVLPNVIFGALSGLLLAYLLRWFIKDQSLIIACAPALIMIPAILLILIPFVCAEYQIVTKAMYYIFSKEYINYVLHALYPVNIWTLLFWYGTLIASLSLIVARLPFSVNHSLVTGRTVDILSWVLFIIFAHYCPSIRY